MLECDNYSASGLSRTKSPLSTKDQRKPLRPGVVGDGERGGGEEGGVERGGSGKFSTQGRNATPNCKQAEEGFSSVGL